MSRLNSDLESITQRTVPHFTNKMEDNTMALLHEFEHYEKELLNRMNYYGGDQCDNIINYTHNKFIAQQQQDTESEKGGHRKPIQLT